MDDGGLDVGDDRCSVQIIVSLCFALCDMMTCGLDALYDDVRND